MIKNTLRIGNFTSSEIVALTTKGSRPMTEKELVDYKIANPKGQKKNIECWPGTAALTYIEETNMERRLGRALCDESNARPLTWGKLIEARAFDLLGLEYSLVSKETIQHPSINYWSGSPDGTKEDTVSDIKCPVTLKSFCQLVDPLYNELTGMDAMNAIRNGFVDQDGKTHAAHKDGEKFYWQLVSNAILTNSKFAELIVYVPYYSELQEIKVMAQMVDASELSKHYWIAMAVDGELPYLVDGGYYKNLNTIRFEVPQSDKDLLTDCVTRAGAMLVERPAVVVAEYEQELQAVVIQGF